jgi:hypothetical protein
MRKVSCTQITMFCIDSTDIILNYRELNLKKLHADIMMGMVPIVIFTLESQRTPFFNYWFAHLYNKCYVK